MKILITGGAGYIGSHTCVELLQSGHEVVVIDNLSNSSKVSLTRVEEITGHSIGFYHIDLLDRTNLDQVFTEHHFDSVIHFAGFKSVAESVADPLAYFHNNVGGSIARDQPVANGLRSRTDGHSANASPYLFGLVQIHGLQLSSCQCNAR